MSSIKTLYTGSTTIPNQKPLIKGSFSNMYKNAYFGEINKIDDIIIENSIKKLYNDNKQKNKINNNVEFISYNDDYSIPKKPKILYPKKIQKS